MMRLALVYERLGQVERAGWWLGRRSWRSRGGWMRRSEGSRTRIGRGCGGWWGMGCERGLKSCLWVVWLVCGG